jgi:hypothetical protein
MTDLEDAQVKGGRGGRHGGWRLALAGLLIAVIAGAVGAGVYALISPAPTVPAPTQPTTPKPTTAQPTTAQPMTTMPTTAQPTVPTYPDGTLAESAALCQSKFVMRWPSKNFQMPCGVDPSLQPFSDRDELLTAVRLYCNGSRSVEFEGTYGTFSKYGDIRCGTSASSLRSATSSR